MGSDLSTPGELAESVDSALKFTTSGESDWEKVSDVYCREGDSAKSGDPDSGEQSVLQTIVESDTSETIKFWWKVSCEEDTDYLEFHIDGTPQHAITGDRDWAEKEYTISSGIHTLEWIYDDNGGYDGETRGRVDPRLCGDELAPAKAGVQWTGYSPGEVKGGEVLPCRVVLPGGALSWLDN